MSYGCLYLLLQFIPFLYLSVQIELAITGQGEQATTTRHWKVVVAGATIVIKVAIMAENDSDGVHFRKVGCGSTKIIA